MKHLLLICIIAYFGAPCVRAENIEAAQATPETWADEKTNTTLVLYRLPKATNAKEVRDQAAGFLEGAIHSGQFLPRSMGNLTFAELPALYMKGVLYGDETEQEVLYLLLFAEEFSATVVAVASHSPDAKSVRQHLEPSSKPLLFSKAITEEIGPKIRDGVSELQVMAREIIEGRKKGRVPKIDIQPKQVPSPLPPVD